MIFCRVCNNIYLVFIECSNSQKVNKFYGINKDKLFYTKFYIFYFLFGWMTDRKAQKSILLFCRRLSPVLSFKMRFRLPARRKRWEINKYHKHGHSDLI